MTDFFFLTTDAFFFQILTSVQPKPTSAVPMLCVITPLALITAPANLATLEMATYVLVTCTQVLFQGGERVRDLIYRFSRRAVSVTQQHSESNSWGTACTGSVVTVFSISCFICTTKRSKTCT